jgi:hypothetical protein
MATVTPNFNWPVPTSTDLVKDGATAIEALGDSIDASLVDLKGGTTGQVLSKNSNTDMDFTWVTDAAGDITGVTAGTGISGGGTSGTVTVTNSMATAIDAKGDLVPGTGADTFARLAVGANGTVLTADSAETTGIKWAAAGGASLNYQLLNSGGTALTGAQNITISGITSKALLVYVVDASSTLAASYMRVKLNNEDNCSTVIWNALDTTLRQAVTDNSIPFGQTGNAQADKVSGVLSVYSADAAGKKPLNFTGAASGTGRYTYWGSGMYDGSAVTSVVFNSSDGNFDGGTIYVYGAA